MNTISLKRILIPTDLSQQSIVSLQYGRFFAEHFSSLLTVIYLADTPDHRSELKAEVHAYADGALAGMPYEVAAVVGQPVPCIVQEAHALASDLIIMATHGLQGWRRLIIGSVTEGVLRAGDCPVLSVSRKEGRLRTPDPITRILCPINFSEASRASLEYASQLAAKFDCELLIAHVVEDNDHPASKTPTDVRSWIDPAVQNRCTFREIVLRGGAAERVLDCAEDLQGDLIVIGAQHKHFRNETMIGTTTERLVRFSTVPVLSVPRRIDAKAADEKVTVPAAALT
jgi:nucleotide-binding universal stress UspA family protein